MRSIREISDSFTTNGGLQTSNLLSGNETAEMIRAIISDFERHGVVVNRSSRLHRYASLFDAKGHSPNNESLQSQLDTALLEIMQFKVIRSSIYTAEHWLLLSRLLSQSIGGNFSSEDDRADCRARSIQFELFTWAYMTSAGLSVKICEPDLSVQMPYGSIISVAAKRPRSDHKIVKNIRAGCHQVAAARNDGVIVVDLSFVQAIRKPIYIREATHYQVLSKIMLDGFVRDRARELCNAARGQNVIGILFHYSAAVRSLHDLTRLVSRRWLFLQTQSSLINDDMSWMITRFQQIGSSTDCE